MFYSRFLVGLCLVEQHILRMMVDVSERNMGMSSRAMKAVRPKLPGTRQTRKNLERLISPHKNLVRFFLEYHLLPEIVASLQSPAIYLNGSFRAKWNAPDTT